MAQQAVVGLCDDLYGMIMIRLPSHSPSVLTAVAGNGGDLREPQGVKVPC